MLRGIEMRNIIIVEDETLIRLGLKVMIDWETYGVRLIGEASNGLEAITLLRREKVDIIITDIRMPDMDGLELMQFCKEEYPHLRFIILSSHNEFEYAQEAIRLGASDYIIKHTMTESEIGHSLVRILSTLKAPDDDIQDDNMIQVEKDQLKSLLLETMLEQETIAIREDEAALFQVHFWYAPIAITLLVPNISECSPMMMKSFLAVVHNHLKAYPIESILYRGKAILIFIPPHSFQNQEWLTCKENLDWKIEQTLGFGAHWSDTKPSNNWLRTRRVIQTLLLVNEYKKSDGGSQILQKAKLYMDEHFQESIGLDQVAEYAGISANYLSRLFKQSTGESFVRYLSKLKIAQAKILLLNDANSVASVGEKVGYPNPRYFSKWFKIMTGLTPQEFKKLNH
jgi:two-component system response regulator YesN